MVDINDLNRELSGRQPWTGEPAKKSKTQRKTTPAKAPAPTAPHWASAVAEDWMRLANESGMEPPYNVNFLANEIVTRTWREPRFRDLQKSGRENDVYRWVAEMVAAFWKTDREDGFTYVRAGDSAGKIRDVFLVEVWDDLRDTAFDTLRARYLKEHGRAKPMKTYERQDTTEMHQSLRKVAMDAYMAKELQAREEIRDLHPLDEQARAVLSSAVEKRRTK